MKWPIDTNVPVVIVWSSLVIFVIGSWISCYSLVMKDLDMLPYALSSVGVSIVIIWITGIWSE